MSNPPRDRDVLLICGAAVAVGLLLFVIGTAIEGVSLVTKLTGR